MINPPRIVSEPETYELRYDLSGPIGPADLRAILLDSRRRGAPQSLALFNLETSELMGTRKATLRWTAREGQAPHNPLNEREGDGVRVELLHNLDDEEPLHIYAQLVNNGEEPPTVVIDQGGEAIVFDFTDLSSLIANLTEILRARRAD